MIRHHLRPLSRIDIYGGLLIQIFLPNDNEVGRDFAERDRNRSALLC